jgi:hypothetical protein
MGGNFANWGLMFSVFDCTFLYLRQKVSMPMSTGWGDAASPDSIQHVGPQFMFGAPVPSHAHARNLGPVL